MDIPVLLYCKQVHLTFTRLKYLISMGKVWCPHVKATLVFNIQLNIISKRIKTIKLYL